MHWLGVLLASLVLSDGVLPGSASELIFFLDGGSTQCFYQHIEPDSSLQLSYYVLRGGDYRVSVQLSGPDGRLLYERSREAFDNVAFAAHAAGAYSVCVADTRSSGGAKCVSVEVQVTAPARLVARAAVAQAQADQAAVAERLSAIGVALATVKMTQGLVRHRASVDATRAVDVNQRVARCAVAQSALIVAVGAVQILTVRRLFELPARRCRS